MSCQGYLYQPVSEASINRDGRRYRVTFAVVCDNCEHADNVLGYAAAGDIPLFGTSGKIPPYGTVYARFLESAPNCQQTPVANKCGPSGANDPTLAFCDGFVRVLDYKVRPPSKEECRVMAERGHPCCQSSRNTDCVLWMLEALWQPLGQRTPTDLENDPALIEPQKWCPDVSREVVPSLRSFPTVMRFEGYAERKLLCADADDPCAQSFSDFKPLVEAENKCVQLAIGDCTAPVNSAGVIISDIRTEHYDIEITYSDYIVGWDDEQGTQLCALDFVNADDVLIRVDCRTFRQLIPKGKGKLTRLSLVPESRVVAGVEVSYFRRTWTWRLNPNGWCIDANNRGLDRCAAPGAPDGISGVVPPRQPGEQSSDLEPILSKGQAQTYITEPVFLDARGQELTSDDPQQAAKASVMRWCPPELEVADLIRDYGGSGVNVSDGSPWISAPAPTP